MGDVGCMLIGVIYRNMKIIKTLLLSLLGLFLPAITLAERGEGTGLFAGLIGLFIFVIYFVFIGGFIILGILGTVVWVWMLVDCAKREFKNENDKLLWILVIVLAGVIGAIVYYFVVKKQLNKKVVKKPRSKKVAKKRSSRKK